MKSARSAPPWSEREDQLICQMRGKGAAFPLIAAALRHRTPDAVARRIQNLIKAGSIQRRMTVDPRRRRWTPREDAAIRRMRARGATLSEIASKLQRTFNAVANRAHDLIGTGAVERLGPPRTARRWTGSDELRLEQLRNQGRTMQEVALILGRSVYSVTARVAELVRKGKLKLLHHYKPRISKIEAARDVPSK